jgi:phosphoglucosamine mutase
VRLERSAVGDRHVADLMRHFDAAFGGEPSGHIVLARDDLGTPAPLIGDALVAGIRVLQAAHRLGRPLSALRKERVRHPQRLVNVPMVTRIPLERWPAFQQALAAERARCGDAARFVIRYSGTEPLLRIMVEGRDAALVDGAVEALADVARAATAPTP